MYRIKGVMVVLECMVIKGVMVDLLECMVIKGVMVDRVW